MRLILISVLFIATISSCKQHGRPVKVFPDINESYENRLRQYKIIASRIRSFDTTGKMEDRLTEKGGDVILINSSGSTLRFGQCDEKLCPLPGGMVFVLYEYKNNFLYKETCFDENGNLANKSDTAEKFYGTILIPADTALKHYAAITIYDIVKPELLKKKLNAIHDMYRYGDAIDFSDENLKMVRANYYNAHGQLFQQEYISAFEYSIAAFPADLSYKELK
jgi:hypothetical protein